MIETQLLSGKQALITGCAKGIGHAMLLAFARHGAHVWAHARAETPEFKAMCLRMSDEHQVSIQPLCFDLLDKVGMKQAVQRVAKGPRIEVLINNAGITLNALHQMTTEAALREQMEVNFVAPFLLTQLIVKGMLRHGSGVIVNVASTAAIDGNAGRAAYGASKAALIAATRSLAREVGSHGIRANVIAPGITDTSMLDSMSHEVIDATIAASDLRRRGLPADIASAAVFLASDMGAYITGQVLRVDGGM